MFESRTVPIFTSDKPLDDVIVSSLDTESSENDQASSPTILVVDDERLIADTISEILDGAGYIVTTAYDGREALELATKLKPAYLLTDVLMPRMDGVELAIAIKKVDPTTKVLLFSGNVGTSALLEQGRKQGYEFQVLGKPVHPAVLIKRLGELQ